MKRGDPKLGKAFRRRDPADDDRLRALVREAFNAVQRVYRRVCCGRPTRRGDTNLQKINAAIDALSRARSRLLLEQTPQGSSSNGSDF